MYTLHTCHETTQIDPPVVRFHPLMISFLDHMSKKTRSQKHKHVRVLIDEGDTTTITWILVMQKSG